MKCPGHVKYIHSSFVFLICIMFYNHHLAKYKLHHLLFWILLFGLWYYLRYQDYKTPEIAVQITFLKVADLALLVYLTNYLLIPKLLYKKYYVVFIIVFLFREIFCLLMNENVATKARAQFTNPLAIKW